MAEPSLTERAEALTVSVAALTASVQSLATAQKHTRRVVAWTVVGLILDLVLTVAAGLLFRGQQHAADRLAEQGRRIEEVQRRTSDEVLCPLYALLLAFEPRAATSPTISETERQERQRTYAVIHRGYEVLGCR